MTLLEQKGEASAHLPVEKHSEPTGYYRWLSSTDHKVIGKNYMYTAIVFMLVAGLMASM